MKLTDFKFVSGYKLSRKMVANRANMVAIPLLNITAYGDELPPERHVPLSEATIEEVLTAPLEWCPHPGNMICMHVSGDSMLPLITPEAVIAVDTHAVDRGTLLGKSPRISPGSWLQDCASATASVRRHPGLGEPQISTYRHHSGFQVENCGPSAVVGE